jgi:glycosyltransferase involved in cell wall biosynthesis
MRILYCNKYNFGFSGTEAYLFDTMELMRSRGHEVALFSMADERGQATAYDQHFVPHIDFKTAQGLATRARLAMHAIYSPQAREKMRQMITDFQPDVAHVRNIYHHLSPSILCELKAQGVPVLYHMNDFKLLCPSYNMVSAGQACERCKGGKFFNVVREGCYAGGRAASAVLAAEAYLHSWLSTYEQCVDMILAPSQFVKHKLMENGWDAAGIQVLPHFQTVPLRSPPNPAPGAPILYFGRLSPEKGVDDLLAAMAQLPHIQLVIAGDGSQRGELESALRESRLRNVSFAGQLSGAALEELIAESQFTVFPSRAYETLGKSILESYAMSRPVVASDLGSRREVVQQGETGVLYGVGDVGQLAAAIAFLHDRPELAARMGEAGRGLVRVNHSPEQHFLALGKIYEQLAVRTSAPRFQKAVSPLPLRIAFIGGRGVVGKYSGIETYYEEIGMRLAEKGHRVTAYCRSYFTPAIPEYRGVRIVRLPTIRSKHLETSVHTFLSTIHACFSKYDIVHYHTLGPSLFSFLPRLFGKKTVVTVQGLDWQRKKWSWLARKVLKLGEWASARWPNQTTVVSRTLQKHYLAQHSKETVYTPNGTQLRKRRHGSYLGKLGLVPSGYVLYLGRFSPEKNCDLLIDAFEKAHTPLKLVLAGGSSHTEKYVTRLRRHESDRIQFLDWLSGDAFEEVLTNAALFVLPSDIEGLSLALLDAMGAGVCVLASDVPENREVIEDTGFVFKRGDVPDLQRMLSLLLSDARLREIAAGSAQQRVRQHYLWGKVAKEIVAVYEDVVAPSKNKPGLAMGAESRTA